MRADPASSSGAFAAGLLNPAAAVPETVTGRKAMRYAVYRNNVTVGLARAMGANFPVVRRLLGEEYFAGLAREFVQQHPPHAPLMFHYGEIFAEFLSRQENLLIYPYLSDVARLEQQMRVSYHKADVPCLQPHELASFSEDALMLATFTPHPAMAIVASDFAILSIHCANQRDPVQAVADVVRSETVLVTRPAHNVELHPLDPSQYMFMASLAKGQTLGEAAASAFDVRDDFALSAAISLLLTSGAFQS